MLRKLIGAISGMAFGIVEGAHEGWRIGWKKEHIAGGFLTPYIVIAFSLGLYSGFTYPMFDLPPMNIIFVLFYRLLSMILLGYLFSFVVACLLAIWIVRFGEARHIFKKEYFEEKENTNQKTSTH